MAEDKVFYNEVLDDAPFPGQDVPVVAQTQSNPTGTYTPTTTPAKRFPVKRTAVELLSTALNTRSRKILEEFEFVQHGAIQIGKYEPGVSGDMRLTPNGQVGRNKSGITTFGFDTDTGSATFLGEVQAGSFISGLVVVGDNSVVIDGDTKRMVFYDDSGIPVIVIGNA